MKPESIRSFRGVASASCQSNESSRVSKEIKENEVSSPGMDARGSEGFWR